MTDTQKTLDESLDVFQLFSVKVTLSVSLSFSDRFPTFPKPFSASSYNTTVTVSMMTCDPPSSQYGAQCTQLVNSDSELDHHPLRAAKGVPAAASIARGSLRCFTPMRIHANMNAV